MKLHPRYYIVSTAQNEFQNFLLSLESKYDLTYGELLSILGSEVSNTAKYMIRQERHGEDSDKKGDEA